VLRPRRWFKGFVSRPESEQMLATCGLPGAYLLRFSATQAGCFALSYIDPEWVRPATLPSEFVCVISRCRLSHSRSDTS
jgi:hypothetical protein